MLEKSVRNISSNYVVWFMLGKVMNWQYHNLDNLVLYEDSWLSSQMTKVYLCAMMTILGTNICFDIINKIVKARFSRFFKVLFRAKITFFCELGATNKIAN